MRSMTFIAMFFILVMLTWAFTEAIFSIVSPETGFTRFCCSFAGLMGAWIFSAALVIAAVIVSHKEDKERGL